MSQQFGLWLYKWWKWQQGMNWKQRDIYTTGCSLQHYIEFPEGGSLPCVHEQRRDKQNLVQTYKGVTLRLENGWNVNSGYSIEKPYVTWNKSEQKDKYCKISLTWTTYNSQICGHKVEWWLSGIRSRKNVDLLFNECSISLRRWRSSRGRWCWWLYAMPEKFTIKVVKMLNFLLFFYQKNVYFVHLLVCSAFSNGTLFFSSYFHVIILKLFKNKFTTLILM
jgi:hypothetical protein